MKALDNEIHILRSDNLVDKNNNGYFVKATTSQVENACKKVLGWRSSTKRYDSIIDRFNSTGSIKYDKVIKYLAKKKGC